MEVNCVVKHKISLVQLWKIRKKWKHQNPGRKASKIRIYKITFLNVDFNWLLLNMCSNSYHLAAFSCKFEAFCSYIPCVGVWIMCHRADFEDINLAKETWLKKNPWYWWFNKQWWILFQTPCILLCWLCNNLMSFIHGNLCFFVLFRFSFFCDQAKTPKSNTHNTTSHTSA